LSGIWQSVWCCIGRSFYVAIVYRTGIHAKHNSNIPLVYTLELTLNLNEFDPKYPKNPQNLGERIRKARMDKGLLQRELAEQIGVSEDTVINWEVRDIQPEGRNLERIRNFLEI